MNEDDELTLKAIDLRQRTTEALRRADHELLLALEREMNELRARIEALEKR